MMENIYKDQGDVKKKKKKEKKKKGGVVSNSIESKIL
jgi:hypothetical protein